MKDKLVIIGANEFQYPLICKAQQMGYETHVFAWKCGDIGEKQADFFYPISITEKDEILSYCQKIKPKGICTIASDLAVLTVTYIASKMGLPTNDYENSLQCTNKYAMRKALENGNIKVPNYYSVNENTSLSNISYPKVVKPVDRSGSRAISLVNDLKELKKAVKNACDNSFINEAIVEDVIGGDREYSCETISFNGEHNILAITKKYTTGFPSCIETAHIEPSDLNEAELAEVQRIIPQALNALSIKNGASHSEFIIDNNGQVNIVEIGARMGGDCIGSHLVKLSTGFDFIKMVIDVAVGKKPELIAEDHYNYALIKFAFSHDDILLIDQMDKKLLIEKRIEKDLNHEIVDSSSRYGYAIFAGNNDSDKGQLMKGLKLK